MRYFSSAAGWLVAVVLLLVLAGSVWATPPKPYTIYIGNVENQPVQIGQRVLVPLHIESGLKYKSIRVRLELNERAALQNGVTSDSVVTEEILVDLNEQMPPSVVYLPVTINGEGRFNLRAAIQWELELEGASTSIFNLKTKSNFYIDGLDAFAFEGKVFFGRSSAFEAASRYFLAEKDLEYAKLVDKRAKINSGLLRSVMSESEQKKIEKLEDEADKELRKRFYGKYPIKLSPYSLLRSPSIKPQKGENVSIKVNFPIGDSYASFLPLDQAKITIINNANNSEIASGILNNGEYSFISPENNLSFTAKVTAQNRA